MVVPTSVVFEGEKPGGAHARLRVTSKAKGRSSVPVLWFVVGPMVPIGR